MVKDSFSGKEIPRGTGLMYVKKDGTISFFASKKTPTFAGVFVLCHSYY